MVKIIAHGCFRGFRASLDDSSISQHHFKSFHIIPGCAILNRPMSAGISRHHTANCGNELTTRVRREHEILFGQLFVEVHTDDARLYPCIKVVFIDFQNLVHPVDIQENASFYRKGSTSYTCP